jgi:anti-sigma B factor antagonist
MDIETMEIGGAKVLGLSGEIDMHTSPALRKALLDIIKHKPPEVVVDFGGVTYIDSSGIATFVEGLKAMRTYKGKLKLAAINENIMEIFRFAKLDMVFSTYDTVNSALKG